MYVLMTDRKVAMLGALLSAGALAACGDSTGLGADGSATVVGRVEQTTPAPAGASPQQETSAQQASGTHADAVAVVQVQGDGSLMELARSSVEVDGSFRVEGVPPRRDDLEAVAYVDGVVAGKVLIHERSRAGAVIVTEPIDYETTVEGAAYSELRAEGATGAAASELALFVQVDGASAAAAAMSEAEARAIASAYTAAGATMTAVHSASHVALDATARAELVAEAAVEYAADRYAGMSVRTAHDIFTDASLGAFGDTHAVVEATVLATAAAATTFDASLEGESSVRPALLLQPLRMNLRARERLAARFASSAEASLAADIEEVLASGRVAVQLAGGLIELRATITSLADALIDTAADGAVELLASSASPGVQAEVRARAEAALEVASLGARLEGVTTAEAAVESTVSYRAAVRSAVQSMIAAAGSSSVSVDSMTSLFIAACGGSAIR